MAENQKETNLSIVNKYYSIVTNIGAAAIANATILGGKVNITHFALGDGQGGYYQPQPEMTKLKNEVWRGKITAYEKDPESQNILKISSIISSTVGGFVIREMAAFDDNNRMIAICNTPDIAKVVLTDGVVSDMQVEIKIVVTNTDVVAFNIDPTVIIATKKDIENHNVSNMAHKAILDKKANITDLNAHKNDTTVHITSAYTTNLNQQLAAKATTTDLNTHKNDTNIHVTSAYTTNLNQQLAAKATTTDLNTHKNDKNIHVTAADKTSWVKKVTSPVAGNIAVLAADGQYGNGGKSLATIANDIATSKEEVKTWATETFSNPNLLMNGDFQVWQRGTSFDVTVGMYMADRWLTMDSRIASMQRMDNTSPAPCRYMAKLTYANAWNILSQPYEDYDSLVGETVTASFWVRIDGQPLMMQAGFGSTVKFTATSQWMYVCCKTVVPEREVSLSRLYERGFKIASIADKMDGGRIVYIAGVKAELGSIATPFVPRSYGEELALCQRYFERIGRGYSSNLSTVTGLQDSEVLFFPIHYTQKRVAPTITADASNLRVLLHDKTATLHRSIGISKATPIYVESSTALLQVNLSSVYNGTCFYVLQRQDTVVGKGAVIDADAEIY